MADIYKDVRMHYPNSGKYIRLLFMEHFHSTCTEKMFLDIKNINRIRPMDMHRNR